MPFFRVGVLANGVGDVWVPRKETLNKFVTRNFDREITYFEDREYKKTVEYFQKRFKALLCH